MIALQINGLQIIVISGLIQNSPMSYKPRFHNIAVLKKQVFGEESLCFFYLYLLTY